MGRMVELTLPAVAFLDGQCHLGDTLKGRTVLLHVRSASVVEVLDAGDVGSFEEGVPVLHFTYRNRFVVDEPMVAAAHYVHGGMGDDDLAAEVLRECADFYCRYAAWEDRNIEEEDVARLN